MKVQIERFYEMWWFIGVLVLVVCSKNGQAYKAAVFEHYPNNVNRDPRTTILENIQLYRNTTSAMHDQGADILVFPEYGLTGLEAEPLDDFAIDISANTYNVITELSNMAKEYNMYLVVNLLEKVKGDNRKTKYYNTNLVFSRNGSTVAKYRKINLFDEDRLTPGQDSVTFQTDFGVTFGLVNAFDLLFYNPSRKILNDSKVTDVVCPGAWRSTMPFYASLSIQHGYAVANGVNLLTASYDQPKKGFGGSSIVLADGRIRAVYIDVSTSSKRVINEVDQIDNRRMPECRSTSPQGLPVNPSEKPTIADFVTDKRFSPKDYTFEKVDLNKDDISTQVCDGGFCCTFNITVGQRDITEHYKLMAFDGQDSLGGVNRNVKICSLLSCDSDSDSSCGGRFNGTTTFSSIRVQGTFKKGEMGFSMPITLNVDLKPIDSSTYCEETVDKDRSKVQLWTRSSQKNVLVFGVYGVGDVSGSIQHSAMYLLVLLAVLRLAFL